MRKKGCYKCRTLKLQGCTAILERVETSKGQFAIRESSKTNGTELLHSQKMAQGPLYTLMHTPSSSRDPSPPPPFEAAGRLVTAVTPYPVRLATMRSHITGGFGLNRAGWGEKEEAKFGVAVDGEIRHQFEQSLAQIGEQKMSKMIPTSIFLQSPQKSVNRREKLDGENSQGGEIEEHCDDVSMTSSQFL